VAQNRQYVKLFKECGYMRHVFFTREFSGLNHFNNHGYHTWLRSVILLILRFNNKISCRRAAATICPRPDLQRKHAAAA